MVKKRLDVVKGSWEQALFDYVWFLLLLTCIFALVFRQFIDTSFTWNQLPISCRMFWWMWERNVYSSANQPLLICFTRACWQQMCSLLWCGAVGKKWWGHLWLSVQNILISSFFLSSRPLPCFLFWRRAEINNCDEAAKVQIKPFEPRPTAITNGLLAGCCSLLIGNSVDFWKKQNPFPS